MLAAATDKSLEHPRRNGQQHEGMPRAAVAAASCRPFGSSPSPPSSGRKRRSALFAPSPPLLKSSGGGEESRSSANATTTSDGGATVDDEDVSASTSTTSSQQLCELMSDCERSLKRVRLCPPKSTPGQLRLLRDLEDLSKPKPIPKAKSNPRTIKTTPLMGRSGDDSDGNRGDSSPSSLDWKLIRRVSESGGGDNGTGTGGSYYERRYAPLPVLVGYDDRCRDYEGAAPLAVVEGAVPLPPPPLLLRLLHVPPAGLVLRIGDLAQVDIRIPSRYPHRPPEVTRIDYNDYLGCAAEPKRSRRRTDKILFSSEDFDGAVGGAGDYDVDPGHMASSTTIHTADGVDGGDGTIVATISNWSPIRRLSDALEDIAAAIVMQHHPRPREFASLPNAYVPPAQNEGGDEFHPEERFPGDANGNVGDTAHSLMLVPLSTMLHAEADSATERRRHRLAYHQEEDDDDDYGTEMYGGVSTPYRIARPVATDCVSTVLDHVHESRTRHAPCPVSASLCGLNGVHSYIATEQQPKQHANFGDNSFMMDCSD